MELLKSFGRIIWLVPHVAIEGVEGIGRDAEERFLRFINRRPVTAGTMITLITLAIFALGLWLDC